MTFTGFWTFMNAKALRNKLFFSAEGLQREVSTHIVMAQHDSFGVASCSRGVDEGAALVGPKTFD